MSCWQPSEGHDGQNLSKIKVLKLNETDANAVSKRDVKDILLVIIPNLAIRLVGKAVVLSQKSS